MRTAALLLTMFGITACGTDGARVKSAPVDPLVLAACPRSVTAPGALPARHPFDLGDGRTVVPIGEANARENMLLAGALTYKQAWTRCRGVVTYIEDRDAVLSKSD